MAFYNKKKPDFMKRTVFSNTFEPPFIDSTKKFYAFIEINGKEVLETYEGKFRTEALAHFDELSRLSGGKFNGKLYAFK
jgi:hypothetical protein